jgi:hypothetical protein
LAATNGTEVTLTEESGINVKSTLDGDLSTNFGLSNDTAYAFMIVFDDILPSFYTAKSGTAEPCLRYWAWRDDPANAR